MSNAVWPAPGSEYTTEPNSVCNRRSPSTAPASSPNAKHEGVVPANVRAAFCWPLLFLNALGLTAPLGSFVAHDQRRILSTTQNPFLRQTWRFFTAFGNVLSAAWTIGMVFALALIIYSLATATWTPLDRAELIVAITSGPWMLQQIVVSILFKRAWHRKKNGLFEVIEHWYAHNPILCVCSRQARHISLIPKVVIGVSLVFFAGNVLMMSSVIFKWVPDSMQDLFNLLSPVLTEAEPYKSILRYLVFIGYVGASLYFSLITMFIVIIVFLIGKEFERIAQIIEAAHDRRKRSLSIDIEYVRGLHQQVCKKVEKCDEAFHGILAIIYGCAIPCLLFDLLQVAATTGLTRYASLFWSSAIFIQVLVLNVACSMMHEHAHRPLDVLYDIGVGPEHGTALDTEEARLELLTFINKLTRTNIGLTVWRFAVVTREFVVSLTAYLLTLVIVIIQFKVKANKEGAHVHNEQVLEEEIAHLRVDIAHNGTNSSEFVNVTNMVAASLDSLLHNVSSTVGGRRA